MSRCWRVVHLDPDQNDPSKPGGALHVDPSWQGAGRGDIAHHALTLYVAETPASAVGESFAATTTWTDDMLVSGYTHKHRHLVEYEHSGPIVDLDDSAFLAGRGYRPSDVVARNRTRTQEIALELWLDGITALRWWSYHRPEWRVRSIFDRLDTPRPWADVVEVIEVAELTIDHPSLIVGVEFSRWDSCARLAGFVAESVGESVDQIVGTLAAVEGRRFVSQRSPGSDSVVVTRSTLTPKAAATTDRMLSLLDSPFRRSPALGVLY